MLKLSACFVIILFAGWQPASAANRDATDQRVPQKLRHYCEDATEYARENPDSAIYFTAVAQNRDPGHDKWHRLSSSEALKTAAAEANSTAIVSLRNGVVTVVDFTFQNQFGDSEEFAQYCYRPDGTLAHIHSDLKSYHGDRELVRDIWFGDSGEKLENNLQTYDLKHHEPAKLPSDFWDLAPPEFLQLKQLPFAAELPNLQPAQRPR